MAQNIKFANFVSTTLASGLATGATSLAVTSTTGFPSVTGGTYFYAVLKRKSDGHQEIVKVTKTDTGSPFTIVRAQDGTTDPGTSYIAADIVEIRLNSQALTDLYNEAAFDYTDISGATPKDPLVDADSLPIYDSAAAGLKQVLWSVIKSGMWTGLGALITAGTGKGTPIDADTLPLCDSAAANATKKLSWSDMKATLKTYFDTQYPPSGVITAYAGTSAPSGWLLCYGQDVNRTTYAALFTALSTTYGAGDGVTTFTLPDLRGRVAAGDDNMGGSTAGRITNAGCGIVGTTLGATGGSETHTLTEAQMPAHTHSSASTATTGVSFTGSADKACLYTSGTTGSTGGSTAHNNVQPTIMLNYIIKT